MTNVNLAELMADAGKHVTWYAYADSLDENGETEKAEWVRKIIFLVQNHNEAETRTAFKASQKYAEVLAEKRAEVELSTQQAIKNGYVPDWPSITNSIGMKFVLIPPGFFSHGKGETRKTVMVSKPYYMGAHAVRQRDYVALGYENRSGFPGDDRPVETITWDEAVAFCAALSELPAEKEAGRVYRLPTEAEWEYACRAGTTSRYYSGDTEEDLKRVAWYTANSGATTHDVGKLQPNNFGCYDMHGNVWEWCNDWYAAEAYSNPHHLVETDYIGLDCGWNTKSLRSWTGLLSDHSNHGFLVRPEPVVPEKVKKSSKRKKSKR